MSPALPLPALLLVGAAGLASPAGAQALEAGFTFQLYDIQEPMDALYPLVPGQTPNVNEVRAVVDFPAQESFGGFQDQFLVELTGYLDVATAGPHTFRLTSDDGSRLTIDDQLVVDNNGSHASVSVDGSITLSAGLHPFLLRYFENDGGEELRLEWQPPGATTPALVPPAAFSTEVSVHVTSPGKKQLLLPGSGLRPGLGMPLVDVHPGYDRIDLRPPGFEPMVGGLDFLPDGRLAVASWIDQEPLGVVYLLDGVLGDATQVSPATVTVQQVAEEVLEPLGLVVVGGELYVTQRHELTRLVDLDGDDVVDEHRTVARGWTSSNFHHFTLDLEHAGGQLYSALSTTVELAPEGGPQNGPNPPNRGTVLRVDLATGDVEHLAGGFRTPNGLGFGPAGTLLVTDNQGNWLPCSELNVVEPGRFYGHYPESTGAPGLHDDLPPTPAAVLLPHGEVSSSPTDQVLVTSGPYAGQVLLGELTLGGVRRVILEQVGGAWQGAVLRHTQGLECGVNRLAFGPDGALYVGGIGGEGNWNWQGTTFGLEKLYPNGASVFEILDVRAVAGGFELELSAPAQPGSLTFSDPPADGDTLRAQQWTYTATAAYGGEKQQQQELTITSAQLSPDGRTIHVQVSGLQAGRVVHLVADVSGPGGELLWTPEAWYTLNALP